MFSDDSPRVRAASFWALSIMANKSKADELLEALGHEENPDARLSEIDSFMIFADRHNISAKSINITPVQLKIKPAELSLLHKKPERRKSQVELPSYALEISAVVIEDTDQIVSEDEPVTEIVVEEDSSIAIELDHQIREAKTKVKQILLEITPNVPISLKRIAEVTGVTEKSLEGYLSELTIANPQTGSYFQLEQVFIKRAETVSQVLEPRPSAVKTCTSCGAVSKRYPCETCGEGSQCMTCRLNIGENEETLHCPYCKQHSHDKHLLEWLKIKGTCPNCKEKLNPDEL